MPIALSTVRHWQREAKGTQHKVKITLDEKSHRPRVMIETPFHVHPDKMTRYAQMCMDDSLAKGEAPFAMHLLYPQVLHEALWDERMLGIECGLSWMLAAELVAVYTDYGFSVGVREAIDFANEHNIPVEHRSLSLATVDMGLVQNR